MSTELAIHLSNQAFSSLAAAAIAAGKTPAEQAAKVVETIFSGTAASAGVAPAESERISAPADLRTAVLSLSNYDFDAYLDVRKVELERSERHICAQRG